MSLSPVERAAGRKFQGACRDALEAALELNPPDATVLPFLSQFRHNCRSRGGRSTALELREFYELSPEYLVVTDECCETQAYLPEDAPGGVGAVTVPAGRFGFIVLSGKCSDCELRVHSSSGRLVNAQDRPPLEERRVYGG